MISVKAFTPWQDRLLVKDLPKPKETEGGIIIADTVAMEGTLAEVISVGDAVTMGTPGEIVLYPTNAGWALQVDGQDMRVIRQEQIEGTVSKN